VCAKPSSRKKGKRDPIKSPATTTLNMVRRSRFTIRERQAKKTKGANDGGLLSEKGFSGEEGRETEKLLDLGPKK